MVDADTGGGVPDRAEAVSVLGTAPASTPKTLVRGRWRLRTTTVEQPLEDWTIDGVPLRRVVATHSDWPLDAGVPAFHPPLRADDFWPTLAVENLRALLGEGRGDFDDGRVALLYCPVCADLSCGALSATVVQHPDAVEWRDLGWQDDLVYEDGDETFDVERDGFHPPLVFRFERGPYEALLRRLIRRYMALASAERTGR